MRKFRNLLGIQTLFIVFVMVFAMIALVGVPPVFADSETVYIEHTDHGDSAPLSFERHINGKPYDELVLGAKFDAPNLIELSPVWSIGVEGSKDLRNTNAEEGWEAFGKLTYEGCLICK